tara:strand:- start:352 stop:1365 length:1014 start_codon:yes stop_codon:yes gene_type:complete
MEESVMADDDWNEIDVESAQDGDDKVEYEVEETVTEEKAEPVVESDESFVEVDESAPDPDPVEAAPELEGVDTDGAQKRIRQLVRQRKEREEQIIAQQQELAALQARLQDTEQKNAEVFKKNYDVTERQLQEKSEMARQAYLRAYDDGDKEAMLAAQEAMFDAKQNISLVRQGRQDVEKYSTDLVKQAEAANNQRTAQQQPAYDPKAVEWAEQNTWFGQDQVATAAALAIDANLKNEGYDPTSDDFYKEVDKRLRAELPNKFGAAPASSPKEQVVGGQSRKSPDSTGGKKGNRKVKLTRDDIELAKKWNIPLERYAKEKAKAEKATATGDYTSINVG